MHLKGVRRAHNTCNMYFESFITLIRVLQQLILLLLIVVAMINVDVFVSFNTIAT